MLPSDAQGQFWERAIWEMSHHVADPVYFSSSIRVTFQQIGFATKETAIAIVKKGTPLYPKGSKKALKLEALGLEREGG